MSPNNYVYEITDYLLENFKILGLIKPERAGMVGLEEKLTEVVYYLMSETTDSIHIIITPDTFLN